MWRVRLPSPRHHSVQKEKSGRCPMAPGGIQAAMIETRVSVILQGFKRQVRIFKKTKLALKINPRFSIFHFSFSLFVFLQGLKFNISFSKLELAPSLPLALSPECTQCLAHRYAQLIRKSVHCHQGLLSPRQCVWGQVLLIHRPPRHPLPPPSHSDPANLQVQHLSGADSERIPLQNAPTLGCPCM